MDKLVYKLCSIEKENAMSDWENITEKLSEIMINKARSGRWSSLSISCQSFQVQKILTAWAEQQGLTVSEYNAGFSRGILLSWGYTPIIYSGYEVEIWGDGSLHVNDNQGLVTPHKEK